LGLNLEQKQAVVTEIAAQLGKAQAVIVAEYRGLDVGAVTDLRVKARKSGVYLRVLKNRHTTTSDDRAGHVEELAFDTRTQLFRRRGITSAPQPVEEEGVWGNVVPLPGTG